MDAKKDLLNVDWSMDSTSESAGNLYVAHIVWDHPLASFDLHICNLFMEKMHWNLSG
jgi:hypothetical protein